MTTHHRVERWPKTFSIAYLARRAGMSRSSMSRRLHSLPKMAAVLEERTKGRTKLTLADLRDLDPKIFESIMLGETMQPEEDDFDDELGTG